MLRYRRFQTEEIPYGINLRNPVMAVDRGKLLSFG
jgi:hypothetical protein